MSRVSLVTSLHTLRVQMSDMAVEAVVQHELGDALYHIDNEGQVPEF